jgi:excisionase family DNA binding protein
MTSGPMADDEGLLTQDEVAALLEVPVPTLRRLCREGSGPPHLEIGRQVRFRKATVQRWLTGDLQGSSPAEQR